jgi:hypothetical protein
VERAPKAQRGPSPRPVLSSPARRTIFVPLRPLRQLITCGDDYEAGILFAGRAGMGRPGIRRQTQGLAEATQKASHMPWLRLPRFLPGHFQTREPGILRRKASSVGLSPHFLQLRRLQVPAVTDPHCGGRLRNETRGCLSSGRTSPTVSRTPRGCGERRGSRCNAGRCSPVMTRGH